MLASEPDRGEALIKLGTVLTLTDRIEEGRTWFEAAVRHSPESYDARYALAWSYFFEGKRDEGAERMMKTVRYAAADGRIVEALDFLANHFTRTGDPARARLMTRLADERR